MMSAGVVRRGGWAVATAATGRVCGRVCVCGRREGSGSRDEVGVGSAPVGGVVGVVAAAMLDVKVEERERWREYKMARSSCSQVVTKQPSLSPSPLLTSVPGRHIFTLWIS